MHIDNLEFMIEKMITKGCSKVPIHIWGMPGIAKTAIMDQISERLGFRYHPLMLSQIEPFEILGAFEKISVPNAEGGVDTYLDYLPPKWCFEARKYGKFILFLDEFNRCRPDVLSAVYSLVNERRINGIPFKNDVYIIAASNPDNGRHDVQKLEEAIVGRFMNIRVNPDVDVWLKWSKRKKKNTQTPNIHPDISNYIANNRKALFKFEKDDLGLPVSVQENIKENPRAWERASLIHSCDFEESMAIECLSGIVGSNYAIAFYQSLKANKKPLTIEEIFEMSEDSVARLKEYSAEKTARLDLIQASIDTINDFLNNKSMDESVKLVNKHKALQHVDGIISFLKILPSDKLIQAIDPIITNDDIWSEHIYEDEELLLKIKGADLAISADPASFSETRSKSRTKQRN